MAIRDAAERRGERVNAPLTTVAEANRDSSSVKDFLDLIEEANARNVKPVHRAGEVLLDSHTIYIDKGAGELAKSYLTQDHAGRTLLLMDGKEVEV